MVEVHDVMGLREAQVMYGEADADASQIYADLAQGILDHYRRSSIVQEWMQLDAAETPDEKERHVMNTNLAAANVLAQLNNRLVSDNMARAEKDKWAEFFSPQKYNRVEKEGLRVLTPDEARVALRLLEREIEATNRFHELVQLSNDEVQRAQESRNLGSYLLWWHVRDGLSVERIIGRAIYKYNTLDQIPVAQKYATDYQKELPRWEAEARAIRVMHEQIRSIPDDPRRPKAVMKKLTNRKYNPKGDAHILIEYPEETFKRGGFSNSKTNQERKVFFAGPELTRCINHAYNSLFEVTSRKGDKDEPVPRPFYFSAYQVEGVEGIPDFPAEAKRFIEIYIPDGDVRLPTTRQVMQERYHGLIYGQRLAIEQADLGGIYISDDSLAHFVVGRDEDGNVITQDTVHYAVKAMTSGWGNAPLIDVTDFFPLP